MLGILADSSDKAVPIVARIRTIVKVLHNYGFLARITTIKDKDNLTGLQARTEQNERGRWGKSTNELCRGVIPKQRIVTNATREKKGEKKLQAHRQAHAFSLFNREGG